MSFIDFMFIQKFPQNLLTVYNLNNQKSFKVRFSCSAESKTVDYKIIFFLSHFKGRIYGLVTYMHFFLEKFAVI